MVSSMHLQFYHLEQVAPLILLLIQESGYTDLFHIHCQFIVIFAIIIRNLFIWNKLLH